jgi:C4-dicarboxylate-specific signal transduction histidine kinase
MTKIHDQDPSHGTFIINIINIKLVAHFIPSESTRTNQKHPTRRMHQTFTQQQQNQLIPQRNSIADTRFDVAAAAIQQQTPLEKFIRDDQEDLVRTERLRVLRRRRNQSG